MDIRSTRPTPAHHCRRWIAAATLAGALAVGAPALADWLVTTDGERIETRGAWKVEGRRVVFELPNGTLTTLRAEEVDLEQSRIASSEQPQQPTKAPARTPVLVLTDDDVARASEASIQAASSADRAAAAEPTDPTDRSAAAAEGPSEEAAEGEAGEATPNALATSRKPDLEVTSWREETADTGIRFLGTLENGSPDFAALLSVEVSLYDEAGALIDTRPARLAKSSLGPGANTTFDVLFDGVYAHGDVIFTPDGRSLRSRTREEAAGEATPEAEGEDAETAIAPEATAPDEPPPAP